METPDNASEVLTGDEIAAVRRIAHGFRVADDAVPLNMLPEVFRELGLTASSELITAMASDYVPEGTENVPVSIVLSVVADWRLLLRVQLRRQPSPLSPEEFKRLTGRNLLVADANWRTLWSLFVMVCGFSHWCIVLTRDIDEGLTRPPTAGYVAADWLLSLVYTIDIALWFRTLKVTTEGVIDEGSRVAHLHLRSAWFWTDVASTVPLDVILSLAGAPVASAIVSHLRLLRYPRGLTIFSRSFEFDISPARIVLWIETMPLWFLMYIVCGIVTTLGFLHALNSNSEDCGKGKISFLQAVYWVVQTLTTVGYGDQTLKACNNDERWLGIVLVFLGFLINAVAIGRLVTTLQRGNAYSSREDKLRETLAVLKYFRIPDDLQTEILSFQEHVLWNDTANAYFAETTVLPQSMRDTMMLQTRVDVLQHVKYFQKAPDPALVQLSTSIIATAFKPEEYISFAGDPHAGVRFVLFGFIIRFDSRGHYVCVLKVGDTFGFEGILAREDEQYSHKALSYCDIWVLQPSALYSVLEKFPQFYDDFRHSVPLTTAEKEMVESGALAQFHGGADISSNDPEALLKSLRHLRWRLEQAVNRKAGK